MTNKQNQNKPTSENVRTTTLRQETQEVKTNDSNSIDKESTNNVEHNQQITQKDFSNLNVTSDSENDNANINSTKTEEHLKQADTSHEESDIIDDANQRLEVSSPSSNSNITEENDNSHLNDSQEDIYEQDADIEPSTDNDIQLENQKEVSQSIDINEQDVQPQQNNDTNKADQNANNSASDSNQQQESSNESAQVVKPMIRKGPNIKLPSVSLLEQPQVIEPNEDWIADKSKNLTMHYITLMYLLKFKM